MSHGRSQEAAIDSGMADSTCLASNEIRAGSAERKGKQQCEWTEQWAEYITRRVARKYGKLRGTSMTCVQPKTVAKAE
jgi:hypothetical protein